MEKLLDRREVAEALRRSMHSIWRDTHEGKIRAVKIGRSLRYPLSEVERIQREGL